MLIFLAVCHFLGDLISLGFNYSLYQHLLAIHNSPYTESGTEDLTPLSIILTFAITIKSGAAIALSILYILLSVLKVEISNRAAPSNDEHPSSPTRRVYISWYTFFYCSNILFILLGLGGIIADGYIGYTYSNRDFYSAIAKATGPFYSGPGTQMEQLRNTTQEQYGCCFYRSPDSPYDADNYSTVGSQFNRPAQSDCPSSWQSLCLMISCSDSGCSFDAKKNTATPCNCNEQASGSVSGQVANIPTLAWWAFGVSITAYAIFFAIDFAREEKMHR